MSDESNPFIIPAPPPLPKPEPAVVSREKPEDDPAGFITLPPGIVDSATHRLADRAPREERQAADDIVFFAAPPGAPVAASPLVDERAAPETAPVAVVPSWHLGLPDGRAIAIAGVVYLGRDPAATAEHPSATLLPLDDPAKTLSKTHALLEVVGDVVWVHDLGSTNGTVIVEPDGSAVDVPAGQRSAIAPGSDLELGEYVIRLELQ